MMRYFELYDDQLHTDKPSNVYGVLRQNTGTGQIERWNDGAWVANPSAADVVVGGEPGAREVSEAQALACIKAGKLIKVHPAHFTGAQR